MTSATPAAYQFDVLVIGGGHAGIEAAAAAARIGARTALVSGNLDTLGLMSCNPAIGGVAKGQIVREIDAMSGLMGRAIDAAGIQFRMLNRRKGPAMHGPRAQADKRRYQQEVKLACESQPGLSLRQEIVEEILTEPASARPRVVGVRTASGAIYRAGAVVLCAGTFLRGLLHYGSQTVPGGRAGELPSVGLSQSLVALGIRLERFKTGTPPRLNGRTIDYSQTTIQPGDDDPEPFSFLTDRIDTAQIPCWITYTNAEVHALIQANLHRAPMYCGQIRAAGPRYCPSIETKIVRFADRDHHQLFLEPEGRHTHEVYINGLSTSLPCDVQDAMIRLIPGLQRAEIVRYGYAIEYDYAPPDQLEPSLAAKPVENLFLAGQVNGTTGYEEAAAQGLVAGANAAMALRGASPLVLGREQAYVGVMIDDLVTRSVDEPYRMFTSRAEHRLRLRHDNADRRLTPIGRALGLVDDSRWARLQTKEAEIARVARFLEETAVDGTSLARMLRRPHTGWSDLVKLCPQLAKVPRDVACQLDYDAKYSGYIARQEVDVARQARLDEKRIPADFDYTALTHLRAEAVEKLQRIRPVNISQAGRISGITPADIAVLLLRLQGSSRPSP